MMERGQPTGENHGSESMGGNGQGSGNAASGNNPKPADHRNTQSPDKNQSNQGKSPADTKSNK